ncbi:MAG: DUF3306 domain-containing protein [Burkholderiaceae bacterium]|nr:DUF3306 domain-containing protein [Burkholderiaceae bacterium]
MAEGFLGRWSQRKQALREGKAVEEPPVPAVPTPAPAAKGTAPAPAEPAAAPEVQAPPPPTLEDVQALTPQSDFRRYVAGDVDPEVRHAAMRTLFSDPHFNVMDGLDIYIEDYNTPNPMPASMLRKMASAQFLGLVEEEKEKKPQPPATVQPADAAVPAQDPDEPEAPRALAAETDETPHHDDPDLRLQQDHASGPQGPGRGA